MNNTAISVRASSGVSSVLLAMPYIVNIWIGIFLLVLGNIGCIGNVIVFQSQTFRKRAYTIYLFAETISDFFLINIVVLTRVLEKGFGIPIKNGYDYLCKIRQFSTYYFYLTSFTFFTLATMDRILATQRSNALRKWSNRVSLAYKMVMMFTVLWLAVLIHRAFIYAIVNGSCGPQVLLYDIIDNYAEAVLLELCPLMIVFILVYVLRKSLRNVIDHQANVVIVTKQPNTIKRSQLQQIDSQLTLMLLLQAIVAIVSFLPYGCDILYTHITETWPKTPLQSAIEKLMSQLTHVLAYTFFASSFHISMICSRGFRREIKRLFQMKRVHPMVSGTANIAGLPTVQ